MYNIPSHRRGKGTGSIASAALPAILVLASTWVRRDRIWDSIEKLEWIPKKCKKMIENRKIWRLSLGVLTVTDHRPGSCGSSARLDTPLSTFCIPSFHSFFSLSLSSPTPLFLAVHSVSFCICICISICIRIPYFVFCILYSVFCILYSGVSTSLWHTFFSFHPHPHPHPNPYPYPYPYPYPIPQTSSSPSFMYIKASPTDWPTDQTTYIFRTYTYVHMYILSTTTSE